MGGDTMCGVVLCNTPDVSMDTTPVTNTLILNSFDAISVTYILELVSTYTCTCIVLGIY